MDRKNFLLLVCVVFLAGCSGTGPDTEEISESNPLDDFIVAGYLPDYQLQTVNIQSADYLSDVIYFSIEPTGDGDLDLSRIYNNTYYILSQFRSANPNIRILLTVGGWDRSAGFAAMAMTDSIRNRFIEKLVTFCLEKHFNGVDYDWEFPANSIQNQAYQELIIETKQIFAAYGLIVTAALSSGQNLSAATYSALDRIHLMSYDHGGRHATYESAVSDIQVFLDRNVPAEKLALGIPFYGRSIDNFSLEVSYRDIVQQYHPLPDQNEINGIYFNGIEMVKSKTRLALQDSLQGVMVWDLGQDTSDETSLLKAIYQAVVDNK